MFIVIFLTFFCLVECSPWYETVNSTNCIKDNLLTNDWIAPDSVKDLQVADAKVVLISKLNSLLDNTVHTIPELSLRDVSAAKDGLCGLAGMYKALYDTVLTESQMKTMDAKSMRKVVVDEVVSMLGDDTDEDIDKLDDYHLLKYYHTGKCGKY